jgi:GNAT superfamily N-acetyltransferase
MTSTKSSGTLTVECFPLIASRWKDFETLFGARGACGGCWCMSWRLPKAVFEKQKGTGNKKAIKKIVNKDMAPGVLAYHDGQAIGWCAVAPRERFLRLENSRVLAPLDDKPVWSVTCFFIAKPFRRKGVSVELLKGVIKFCRQKGAKIIEAYPSVPYNDKIPDAFAWTGIPSSFEKAGFVEAARRSKSRPIMRYYL